MMKESILFLNNKDMALAGSEDMKLALNDVERTYSLYESGDVISPSKVVMSLGKTAEEDAIVGHMNCMPGYVGGEYDVAGVKWLGSSPMNFKMGLPRASAVVVLNDPETKLPVCIADGTEVSAKRTGASGGIAMKYLAKKDASVITMCGAGVQAGMQVEAAALVLPKLEKVYVYDLFFEKSDKLTKELNEKYTHIAFEPVDIKNLPDAVADSDVVITATLASEPFIKGEWIKKGALIVHLAGYEVDYDCVTKADRIVVDFWENIKHRDGSTIALMYDDGLIKDEQIDAEIGQIVNGKKRGRNNDDEIVYFNACGSGILDLSIIKRCFEKAKRDNTGATVSYWE